jgi:hypothetical protein
MTDMIDGIDGDERTNAVGFFNTARSYWRSAECLAAARVEVTHPQAPITFLFCHAIELYLKAYLRSRGKTVADLKKIGHRVAGLGQAAFKEGLEVSPEQATILQHLDEDDVAIESRYIVTGFKQLPTNEGFSALAEALDKAICSAMAKLGLPVRCRDGRIERIEDDQTTVSETIPRSEIVDAANVSLHDAGVRLYKAAEEHGFLEFLVGLQYSSDKKIEHVKHQLIVDDRVSLSGIRPPSMKSRAIPRGELEFDVFPGDGSTIIDMHSNEIIWCDVSLRVRDLNVVIADYIEHNKRIG